MRSNFSNYKPIPFFENLYNITQPYGIHPREVTPLLAKLAGVEKKLTHANLEITDTINEDEAKNKEMVTFSCAGIDENDAKRIQDYLQGLCGAKQVEQTEIVQVDAENHFEFDIPEDVAMQRFLPKFKEAMEKLTKDSPEVLAEFKAKSESDNASNENTVKMDELLNEVLTTIEDFLPRLEQVLEEEEEETLSASDFFKNIFNPTLNPSSQQWLQRLGLFAGRVLPTNPISSIYNSMTRDEIINQREGMPPSSDTGITTTPPNSPVLGRS